MLYLKNMKFLAPRFFIRLIMGLIILGSPFLVFADTMNSTSFVITSDDLSAGGGNSSSTSFVSEGTAGGLATGENASSASFAACAGYPCTLAAPGEISFSVSPNVVMLDTLTSDMVITGSTTITTSMTATNGYSTVAYTDGGFRTNGGAYVELVADGAVTEGSNEYGVGLSGFDRAFADDRPITTSPVTIAANGSSVTDSSVDVIFKVAASTMNTAGAYQQTVTFISTGSF